jgi:hypothetical protein
MIQRLERQGRTIRIQATDDVMVTGVQVKDLAGNVVNAEL